VFIAVFRLAESDGAFWALRRPRRRFVVVDGLGVRAPISARGPMVKRVNRVKWSKEAVEHVTISHRGSQYGKAHHVSGNCSKTAMMMITRDEQLLRISMKA